MHRIITGKIARAAPVLDPSMCSWCSAGFTYPTVYPRHFLAVDAPTSRCPGHANNVNTRVRAARTGMSFHIRAKDSFLLRTSPIPVFVALVETQEMPTTLRLYRPVA